MELHLVFGYYIDPTASLKSSECYSKIWSKLFQQHNNNCKMEEIQNNGFSRHLYLSNVENSAYKCTISLHGSLRIIGNGWRRRRRGNTNIFLRNAAVVVFSEYMYVSFWLLTAGVVGKIKEGLLLCLEMPDWAKQNHK